jgi:hypothetical protein
MQNNWNEQAVIYYGQLRVATARAGIAGWTVAANWVVLPFVVQTLMHPEDAIRLQLKLEGLPVPPFFTAHQMVAGFAATVIALGVIVLLQMTCTVLFYRRAQINGNRIACPVLWPLAALTGLLGDAGWWYWTGSFDAGGGVIGLSSAALAVGGEILCNKLGREFVFGKPGMVPALYQP